MSHDDAAEVDPYDWAVTGPPYPGTAAAGREYGSQQFPHGAQVLQHEP